MKVSARVLTLIATVSLATAATVASAQSTPNIDQRQANQNARIANGQASGTLSAREAARLNAGQAKVANMESAAKADGVVTKGERRAIKAEQKRQSKRIHRQKHDGNRK